MQPRVGRRNQAEDDRYQRVGDNEDERAGQLPIDRARIAVLAVRNVANEEYLAKLDARPFQAKKAEVNGNEGHRCRPG